jgi:hypothetical protein
VQDLIGKIPSGETPGEVTRKQAPVKQASQKSAQQRCNLYQRTIEPPDISAAIRARCWASAAACKCEGGLSYVQERYRYRFGTHHRRQFRDSKRCHSRRFNAAIGGRKCPCHENRWLSVLPVTCVLSGWFDGAHHVWDIDTSLCRATQPRSRWFAGLQVHSAAIKGWPSGHPVYFRLDQMLHFHMAGFSRCGWRPLRYAAVQVGCCEISVGWHAGIPAVHQEHPEPAAC